VVSDIGDLYSHITIIDQDGELMEDSPADHKGFFSAEILDSPELQKRHEC
jgi:hypothetical protein